MPEQQYRQPSAQLSREQVEAFRAKELKEALQKAFPGWSLEQMEFLQTHFREKGWRVFLAYLQLMEVHLTKEIWQLDKDDRQSTFLRGQKHMIDTIRNAPAELEKVLKARKEGVT